ncbi:MAG: hypothetical protein QNJ30_13815 [Kiloniellales bacterium]|nr:hypothetical protein [Kiloniellales bacterium]
MRRPTALRRCWPAAVLAGCLAAGLPARGLAQACPERPQPPASLAAHMNMAETIVLARTLSAQRLASYTAERLDAAAVVQFETLEVLFGTAEPYFHLLTASPSLVDPKTAQAASLGDGPGGLPPDTDFDGHRDPAFWDLGLSRPEISGSDTSTPCRRSSTPRYFQGHAYLLFITERGEVSEVLRDDPLSESINTGIYSAPLDTAAGYHLFAERVEAPGDLWLAAVKAMLSKAPVFTAARDLLGNPRWLKRLGELSETDREARPIALAPIDYLKGMRAVAIVEAVACAAQPGSDPVYARGGSRVCLRKLRQLMGEDRGLPAKLDWARQSDISRSGIDVPSRLLVYEYSDLVGQSHRAEALAQAGIGWTRLGPAAGGPSLGRMLPIEDGELDFTDLLSRLDFSANPRIRLSDLVARLAPYTKGREY